MGNVQILSIPWYVHGKQVTLKTQHVLKCTDVALEANAVAQAVWDSQGCVDFEPVFYSTEGSPGQKLI